MFEQQGLRRSFLSELARSALVYLRGRPDLLPARRLWGRLDARLRALASGRRMMRALRVFLLSQNVSTRRRFLTALDVGRLISVMDFAHFLSENKSLPSTVAVVSGSHAEPELVLISASTPVSILSFDENPELFDLTRDWRGTEWAHLRGGFDLVLCEQVLEHVPDPARAVVNLAQLLKPGGFLHLSVPAVNNRHGDPHYFYSGFSSEVLGLWLERASLKVDRIASWNSNKGSRMYSTSDWAPLAACGPGIFFWMALWFLRASPLRFWALVFKRIRNFLVYPFQSLLWGIDGRNSVVLWSVARLSATS